MWRVLYPCGIHFLISQIVGYAALAVICYSMGYGLEFYQSQTILMTGITALLTMIPCIWFYQKDKSARIVRGLIPEQPGKKLKPGEGILLLLVGASLATFANMLVALLQNVLNVQEYQENMAQITNGKSLFMLIFWMGVIAPFAEEIVFRWLIYLRLRDYTRVATAAVISGVFFGVYHMNLTQAVYAGILGVVFAYFLEITGSLWASVLLHMGANIWSLLLPEMLLRMPEEQMITAAMGIYLVLLCVLGTGSSYFKKRACRRRMV